MTWIELSLLAVSCLVMGQSPQRCVPETVASSTIASTHNQPTFTGTALDVELQSKAALAWDVETGTILYSKQDNGRRPVASLSKLLSAIAIRRILPLEQIVEIPDDVRAVQRSGADIALPVGQHASVQDLLHAGLVASANDAMVALAVAAKGSEEDFVVYANQVARQMGLENTGIANATGLTDKDNPQYSTASDIRRIFMTVYQDDVLAAFMDDARGQLTTTEGVTRRYKSTDKLLGTYVPVIIAKTGYTVEAGENLALITQGKSGHRLGAVILGSTDRFQDMKVLVEWLYQNYTW